MPRCISQIAKKKRDYLTMEGGSKMVSPFLSLSAVNVFGVFIIQAMPASLELTETTKGIAAAYHGIFAALPLVGVFLMTTDRIPAGTND